MYWLAKKVATAVTAERSFLHHLEGGYSMPVAAHATWQDGTLYMTSLIASINGAKQIKVNVQLDSFDWLLLFNYQSSIINR